MGAGLVVFSGGKGIRGPQCTGLVLGRDDLVAAVRLNGSPYSAIGRGMKVGKEEILALLAAVDVFLSRSDDADRARWGAQASLIAKATAGTPYPGRVETHGQPAAPDFAPRAYVDLPDARAAALVAALRAGDPPIVVRRFESGIILDPMTLQEGEERLVAARLAEELRRLL
jgi:seryl-tRNA(Sec) selenium transferase